MFVEHVTRYSSIKPPCRCRPIHTTRASTPAAITGFESSNTNMATQMLNIPTPIIPRGIMSSQVISAIIKKNTWDGLYNPQRYMATPRHFIDLGLLLLFSSLCPFSTTVLLIVDRSCDKGHRIDVSLFCNKCEHQ